MYLLTNPEVQFGLGAHANFSLAGIDQVVDDFT